MSRPPPIRRLIAEYAPALRAVIDAARPLHYRAPVGERGDLPAHVRAASAIRRHGARRVVVQDDVHALAVVDMEGAVEPLLLPAGPDGTRVFDDRRGNKRLKMDLEACVSLPDGRLVAFGSGSSPERERIVVVGPQDAAYVLHAADLYAALRHCTDSMGVELNVEGAIVSGGQLRLLQRGNDVQARRGGFGNAIFDLPLAGFLESIAGHRNAPAVARILAVDLGAIDGVLYGFTDAAVTSDGRIAFLACAEDSADVRSDGPVLGCRFGWLDEDGVRLTDIVDVHGRPTMLKLEGIEARAAGNAAGNDHVFDVVADMDRPEEAAVIAELRVSG